MGYYGGLLGGAIGGAGGYFLGGEKGGKAGSTAGKALGSLLKFKKGGRIPGAKKGQPKVIVAHVGEYVLPVGVKPTKAQKGAVAKLKRVK